MTRIPDIAPRKSHSHKTKKRLEAKAQRLAEYMALHPKRGRLARKRR